MAHDSAICRICPSPLAAVLLSEAVGEEDGSQGIPLLNPFVRRDEVPLAFRVLIPLGTGAVVEECREAEEFRSEGEECVEA